ncbi:MAG TPA: LON peptidase substrate-binding domain-containing protein [Candidatus Dormibacteraeota bacterium]|jgi:Lon protease-like protein|nr:LON peptidase substrate-binding domain-containing protein [Candidatus Dormibacteraeota bacterium]
MGVEIPLFELGVVLFPHMPLSLHVFEERYRAMLRDCEEQGIGFGVIAIRQGQEVGGGAVAHDAGTLAQIRRVEHLDDGRANLLVTGATRFRVLRRITERAYPAAEVEYLADAPGDAEQSAALATEVRAAFQRYVAALQQLAALQPGIEDPPDEPELLSYLVAASLQVELAHKQRMLEADSAEERLRMCMALLRREATLLDRMLARSNPRIAISPN